MCLADGRAILLEDLQDLDRLPSIVLERDLVRLWLGIVVTVLLIRKGDPARNATH
jgi:hypothetical protein